MTRNEAIDLLDNLIGMVEDNHESDYDTALQMGIKALQESCTHPDKCHECEKILTCTYYKQEPKSQGNVVEPTKIKAIQELVNESFQKGFMHGKEEGIREAKQEPSGDAVSRQKVLDLLEDTNNGWVINEVLQLPSVKPQPCEEAISRQAAIKSIEEKAKRIKNEDTLNGLAGAVAILFDLPSVNPQPKTDAWSIKDVADTFKKHGLIVEQEPCDDAISREELLKAIDTWDKFGCDADTKLVPYQDHYIPYIHYDDVVKCIKGMPTVAISSAEPKTGHWIMRHRKVNTINYRTGEDVLTGEIHTVKELIRYECDEPYCAYCGKRAEDISQDYCGYCGARMEGKQNG